MEIGRHTYGHEQITTRSWGESAELRIGSFCSIADRVTVFLGGNHRSDWVTTFPFPAFADRWQQARGIEGEHVTNGDVVIGNDVWVGSNATIMSGVTVGDGAVLEPIAASRKMWRLMRWWPGIRPGSFAFGSIPERSRSCSRSGGGSGAMNGLKLMSRFSVAARSTAFSGSKSARGVAERAGSDC
jgi:hypothetical protein